MSMQTTESADPICLLPLNKEIIETGADVSRTIGVLLKYLHEHLGLVAASVLVGDTQEGIYSPIFVHPERRKLSKFVRFQYDSKGLAKFAQRMRQSRDAVMEKHGCDDVRYQVYVKNGKAALRIMPAT